MSKKPPKAPADQVQVVPLDRRMNIPTTTLSKISDYFEHVRPFDQYRCRCQLPTVTIDLDTTKHSRLDR